MAQHVLLAFSPATSGLLPQDRTDTSLIGSVWFFLISGQAAVMLFFVLSGFVLSWGFFEDGDPNRIARLFVKRLPRLACLVLLTSLASYLLFLAGQYHFTEAGAVSKSIWLQTFGFSGWTDAFEPSLAGAVYESIATFFVPVFTYNSVLWTMTHEFMGSIFALCLAAFLFVAMGHRRIALTAVLVPLAVLFYASLLFPFAAGVLLAFLLARYHPRVPLAVALPAVALSLYLIGFMLAQGAYAWVSWLPQRLQDNATTVLQTLGAVLLIWSVLSNATLYRALDRTVARRFGELAFALYLIHPLVIFSAGSLLYLALSARGVSAPVTLLAVSGVTLFLSVALAVPLAWIDRRWNSLLDRFLRRALTDASVDADPDQAALEPPPFTAAQNASGRNAGVVRQVDG
jgi:peptidoglycan/LPS O-acetylase OafA/YrhL